MNSFETTVTSVPPRSSASPPARRYFSRRQIAWIFVLPLLLVFALLYYQGEASANSFVIVSKSEMSFAEGGSDSYTVVLNSAPTATVTVTVRKTGDSDITVDTDANTTGDQNTLTFTTTDWNTAKTVTVSAAEDNSDYSNDTASIIHSADSSDRSYKIAATGAIGVTVADNDIRDMSLIVEPASVTLIEGATATFKLKADRLAQPTLTTAATIINGDITINPNPVILSGTIGQPAEATVTLTAGQDGDTADDTATIQFAYSTYKKPTLNVTVRDDDKPAGVTFTSKPSIIAEGGDAIYKVRLNKAPTANVAVTPASSNTDVSFSPTSITFTPANWTSDQTVTLRAAQDAYDDSDDTATISHTASSTDSLYNNLSGIPTFGVTVDDNETFALSAANIDATSATLNLSDYPGNWWYKADKTPDDTCKGPVTTGTNTKALTGLAPGATYTYKAYSATGCADANLIATASAFTTAEVSVSNLAQTGTESQCEVFQNNKCAVGFTTGNAIGGYTLTGVTARFQAKETGAGGFTATLHTATSGRPADTPLATLSGGDPGAAGDHTFTCSADCGLMASTTYFVQVAASTTAKYKWRIVPNHGETKVPSDNGWSIANETNLYNGSTWTTATTTVPRRQAARRRKRPRADRDERRHHDRHAEAERPRGQLALQSRQGAAHRLFIGPERRRQPHRPHSRHRVHLHGLQRQRLRRRKAGRPGFLDNFVGRQPGRGRPPL